METKKRSFFERLTGSIGMSDEIEEPKKNGAGTGINKAEKKNLHVKDGGGNEWIEEENEEAELAVDVYETPTHIMIETMVAGVKPEDLDISVARDMVTIKGKREESRTIDEENYYSKELYWGRFSRTISLPKEVEPEEVEATEKHGLLTIKLQKVDKEKTNNVKVRPV